MARKVFVGGSIRVNTLPSSVKRILDAEMLSGSLFIIGDAPGVDTEVQKYLQQGSYSNVIIYTMDRIRSNIGNWEVKHHRAPQGITGSAYYAVKDREMDKASNEGIMIWDGSSSGTKNNIIALLSENKSCAVYENNKLNKYNNLESFQKRDQVDTSNVEQQLLFKENNVEKIDIIENANKQINNKNSFKEIGGDIWENMSNFDSVCVTTNGIVKNDGSAVMGAGIAKSARDMFPGIDRKLGSLIKENGSHVQIMHTTKDGKLIIAFPTKIDFRNDSSIELIRQSCRELVELVKELNISVVMTRPGVGNGKLDWEREVKQILNEEFTGSNITVIDFSNKIENKMENKEPILTNENDFIFDTPPNPENDGIDHINIYSQSKTTLGKELTNFAKSPFVCDDGKFNSIEGYWYWLGVPEGTPGKDDLRSADGFKAKELGRKLGAPDWGTGGDFEEKIKNAITSKIKQNPQLAGELRESTLPLRHYYVYGGNKTPEPKEGRWVVKHIATIREELQRGPEIVGYKKVNEMENGGWVLPHIAGKKDLSANIAILGNKLKNIDIKTSGIKNIEEYKNAVYITGIGTQETTERENEVMYFAGFTAALSGIVVRSGAARGSDDNWEAGALAGYQYLKSLGREPKLPVEIVEPKIRDGSNKPGHYVFKDLSIEYKKLAGEICHAINPGYKNATNGVKELVERDIAQLLGKDGNTVSSMIFYCATEKNGIINGGSRYVPYTNKMLNALGLKEVLAYNLRPNIQGYNKVSEEEMKKLTKESEYKFITAIRDLSNGIREKNDKQLFPDDWTPENETYLKVIGRDIEQEKLDRLSEEYRLTQLAKKEAEEKQNNKLAQIAAQRLMTEMDNIFKVDKIEAQYHPLTVGEQVFSGKILKRDGSVLAISDINTPGRYTLVDLNKARKDEVLNSDIKEEELVKVKRGDDQVIEITAFINEKDHNEIQSR